MRKGAYDYLMKPCDIEDLVEKIKEAHEAEVIKRHPVLWPRKLVREISLHPFGRLCPEDDLSKALELMSREQGEESIEEVYVLDREDRVLGFVTKRDLVNEAQNKAHPDFTIEWAQLLQHPQWLPQKTMKEVMRPQPLATQANGYLTDAANQMLVHNLRRMPVVRAEKIIGVIKLEDVFQYLDHEME
jgi:CBS domain-containing protein